MTRRDIVRQTFNHIEGPYVPSHALAFDIPEENILAMLEVFQNQEKLL